MEILGGIITEAPFASSGELPRESTSFVGRRRELAEARRLLGHSRLVTLTGTGGVGKTRLAVRLAGSLSRTFADGVRFVALDRISVGRDLAGSVAADLQIETADRSATEALVAYIADSDILLVFDNCEHVLTECAELVARLLRGCPGLKILATSREPLGLSTEAILPVPPMEVPEDDGTRDAGGEPHDAVALFLDRARAAVPGFDPDTDGLRTIAAICLRLEGLPLAIELAAVRLRVLGPDQLLARLADPLGFLNRSPRDAPERQRTLRSSIAWSHELCTPEERWLWSRLSVFAGWELAAAEDIADPSVLAPDEVVDVLQSLIEKSIIVRRQTDGGSWYSMLATIREFGLDTLRDDGALTIALRRHRDWYRKRLRQAEIDWIGPNQARWLGLFHRELPNVRAALDFSLKEPGAAALELAVIGWRICWQAPGRLEEHRRWLMRSIDAAPEDSGLRTQALALSALFAAIADDWGLAESQLALAQETADRVGDAISSSLVDATRAELLPDSPEALELHGRAAQTQADHPDMVARANSATRLSLMYDRMGDRERARATREEVLAISAATGERFESSYLLNQAAIIACGRGEDGEAKALARRALEMKQGLGNVYGMAQAQETLANVAVSESDYERAAILMGASHAMWRTTGTIRYDFPRLSSNGDEYRDTARAALGADRFDLAYERGRTLPLEESVALAFGGPLRPAVEPRRSPSAVPVLSPRESEVTDLVAEGLSDKQIARRLFIAQRTAEGHVQRCLVKLGFTSRAQLAAWSVKNSASPGH